MDVTTGSDVKIIIADDHALFADGVEQIVNSMPGFEVVAKVNNGKLLMQTLNRLQPDLILLDISMPFMDGLETASQIKKTRPGIKIIFISMHYDPAFKIFIQKNDINGYVIKNIGAPELKAALHTVMEGHKVFIPPPEAQAPASPSPENSFTRLYKLTKTETEIIQLIANGDTTKIIADKRGLSYLTVESHRKNIFRKLNAKNMAEVVAFAVKHGIVKNE